MFGIDGAIDRDGKVQSIVVSDTVGGNVVCDGNGAAVGSWVEVMIEPDGEALGCCDVVSIPGDFVVVGI